MRLKGLAVWSLGLCVGIVTAQTTTCPEIVEQALDAVDTLCSEVGRNQACYGNVQLDVLPINGVEDFQFASVGDIEDVASIEMLELSPMNEEVGEWGLVMMSLQADIPDTLPGQNVTFILFGDVTIENTAVEDETPMQAFYLSTGVGDAPCEEAPESGLLVQTPEGVEEVTFNVNGVDVQIGSTVLFQAVPEDEMTITTVEGTAVLNFESELYPAIEGTQLRLPLSDQLLPIARPDMPEAYTQQLLAPLQNIRLPREIAFAPPLMPEDLAALNDRLQAGELPCGVAGLPDCDRLPVFLQDGSLLPPPDFWGVDFIAGETCIALDTLDLDIDLDIEIPDISGLPGVGDLDLPNLGDIGDNVLESVERALPPCPDAERHPRLNERIPWDGGTRQPRQREP